MRMLLLIFTLMSTLSAFDTEKEIHIGTHTFTLTKETYNEYGDKGITVVLYAKDADKSILPHLRIVTRHQSGSCRVKNSEEGTYVIKKDSIIVYSRWKRFTNDYAPIGNRVQVYKLDENGSFYVSDSKVYVERTKRGEDAYEGMQYLYTDANTKNKKLLLSEYIASVEEIFKAKFVIGKEAKKLALQVSEAMREKQNKRWK